MILTIVHKGLKGFFLNGKPLPASLDEHREAICYWLSILNAVTEPKDLKLAGSRCIKVDTSQFRLVIDGLGEFTFVLENQKIQSLNFSQA